MIVTIPGVLQADFKHTAELGVSKDYVLHLAPTSNFSSKHYKTEYPSFLETLSMEKLRSQDQMVSLQILLGV